MFDRVPGPEVEAVPAPPQSTRQSSLGYRGERGRDRMPVPKVKGCRQIRKQQGEPDPVGYEDFLPALADQDHYFCCYLLNEI